MAVEYQGTPDVVRQEGPAECRSAHAQPARLGAIRGTEWWHCHTCGWVWTEHRVADAAPVAIVVQHQRA
jgi:hypothetical protein